jgi:hypothetical protein
MRRRNFLVWLSRVLGGYFGLAAAGSLPQLLRLNTVHLGEAQAAVPEPCVCEGSDAGFCDTDELCVCEGSDLAVCPSDGHNEPCSPDTCTVQDGGCGTGDFSGGSTCRVSDVCDADSSADCRIDSCTSDKSGECVGDACTSDSSGVCNSDNCSSDSSGDCATDQCQSDSSGSCVSDTCTTYDSSKSCSVDQCDSDSSGSCITDTCQADSSGVCQTDNCISDKSGSCENDDCTYDSSGGCHADGCSSDSSGVCASDNCVSDSSGDCNADACQTDSSKQCANDQCPSDASGYCTTDQCDADSSGNCVADQCTSDKSGDCTTDECASDASGECGKDHCLSDSSAACSTNDACVYDSSWSCDTDLCRDDQGGACTGQDICATDNTPPKIGDAGLSRALRWLYRLSMVLLALNLAVPDQAHAATAIDARDAVFSVDPTFQTGQAISVPSPVGAFIRDCDHDGIDEVDTNGDGQCAGDPELRDYNGDGSRELPPGTPFSGTFQFTCIGISSDVALVTTGPVTLYSSGSAGIYGAIHAAGDFVLAAASIIDLHTSAWLAESGTLTFRTALSGTVDQGTGSFTGPDLPFLSSSGVCGGATGIPGLESIPTLDTWALALLGLLLALAVWLQVHTADARHTG